MRHALQALAAFLMLAPAAVASTPREIRVQHVAVKEANAIMRTMLDLRKTAVDEQGNRLFISDDPERIALAEELVARLDVPAPRWRASIVATSGGRRLPVAELALDGGTATWASGGSETQIQDRVVVRIEAASVRQSELHAGIQLTLMAGGDWGGQILRRSESTWQIMRDGDTKTLVSVGDPEAQQAVAKLVGASTPVDALLLVIDRVGASPRDGGLGR